MSTSSTYTLIEEAQMIIKRWHLQQHKDKVIEQQQKIGTRFFCCVEKTEEKTKYGPGFQERIQPLRTVYVQSYRSINNYEMCWY